MKFTSIYHGSIEADTLEEAILKANDKKAEINRAMGYPAVMLDSVRPKFVKVRGIKI